MDSQRLFEIRKQLGLTQTEMAERIGVKLRAYQYWESEGKPIPKPVQKLVLILEKRPVLVT